MTNPTFKRAGFVTFISELRPASAIRVASVFALLAAAVNLTAVIEARPPSTGKPSARQARMANRSEPVVLERTGTHIAVAIDGKPFTVYYFDSAEAKPYLMPLRSARGTIITRGFPIGNTVPPGHRHDSDLEPHQRPMDFGFGDINGIDFWGEAIYPHWSDDRVFGRTVKVKIQKMRSGSHAGFIEALFNLDAPSGRPIGQETQAYAFRASRSTRIIDCKFTLTANQGAPLTFGDTKEGMFELRLAPELNSPPGTIVNSNGAEGESQVWGKRADWVDYDGEIGGERLGVAIFDSPRNFRHPTYWHARGYGLFAANPFGIREFTRDPALDGSWTVRQGKSLTFRYRVFIHEGNYRQAHVAQAWREYAGEQSVSSSKAEAASPRGR